MDSLSTDGSASLLKSYEREGKLKLIQRKCSRGRGRQIALENAKGDYVISGLDMDDTFRPSLRELLRFYHDRAEGNLLAGAGEATIVTGRNFALQLGGWQDLQFRENWEISRRAAGLGKYLWTIFPLVATKNLHPERKGWASNMKYRYTRYRENLRVGHRVFDPNESVGLSQGLIWAVAALSLPFVQRYGPSYAFTSVDHKFFVDSREYWPRGKETSSEQRLYDLFFTGIQRVQLAPEGEHAVAPV